jgi:O-acetyl-ADP-ribose deacetylase (regulator of RNase III)
MEYNEINGDLIKLALKGHFDVIAHGCNCKSVMGGGIAPKMATAFGCNKFPMELLGTDINKLGCIDYDDFYSREQDIQFAVVNAYTQFDYGTYKINLDYEALTLCLRKMNSEFSGQHIGLPQIGCGLAGGDWNRVKEIIQRELKDCDVTIVIFEK